jgi:hypothetical protein
MSSLMVGAPGFTIVAIIRGFTANRDRRFDDAKGHGLRPLRLVIRPTFPAVAQDLGLDPNQVGLDCG